MDRRLAKSVLATLRDLEPREEVLACFKQKSWEKSYDWLDTSGIALYLLNQIRRKRLDPVVPREVLLRLEQNQKDNRARTEQLFCEFVELNMLFRKSGVRFVNLKGVTLTPGYCTDPDLRFQVDLDFLVEDADAELCKKILELRDYRVTGVNDGTWEFKSGRDVLPALRDIYKPKAQRSVEVHFTSSNRELPESDNRIARSQLQSWRGLTFPALSESDKFIGQSIHLYEHLRSEWTRLSWVLEYWTYVSSRRLDDDFWSEVKESTKGDRNTAIAIGMSLKIAGKALGELRILALDDWTTDVLPENFNRWIERYSDDVLFVEFPGSKLYLLLDDRAEPKAQLAEIRRKKLLPSSLPPRVVHSEPTAPFRARWGCRWQELKYLLFRLRFHAATGLRHVLETARWKLVV
jgi:Uncharacterised nucleotidyltransferase